MEFYQALPNEAPAIFAAAFLLTSGTAFPNIPPMSFSIFEIIMLVCFGAAWPFSIYRSYKSRSNAGKSVLFLFVVVTGYIAGALHKIFYSFDAVIYLYILNGVLVLVDILLYFRNSRLMREESELGQASKGG